MGATGLTALPRDLPLERITVKRGDLEDVVLPRLIGTVFHATPVPNFEAIKASGVIRSNQDGQLSFTYPQSQNNYGRRRGYVCLFDLRDVPDGELRDALMKFYFLNHAPRKGHPVFLFLDREEYGKLIPWTVTKGNYKEVVIPYVESWYPSDLSVSALASALAVTVEPDDADSAFRGRMGRFRRDNKEALDTGLTIEASTLAQLKERAEEWVSVAREGGLEVDEGWDEGRIEQSEAGYRIDVHATRPDEPPDPERLCPKCGTELRSHLLGSGAFSVGGGSFVPSTLDCMGCGYSRPVLQPVEDADAPLLEQLTPEEWNLAHGRLMHVWRRWFESDEQFLAAYRALYGDDERLLTAWRSHHT